MPEWVQKLPEGKRRVRVTLFGKKIKWQFQEPGKQLWDYETQPTAEEWDRLVDELERSYQRCKTPLREVELATRERSLFHSRK
jgi:hypothetical protein